MLTLSGITKSYGGRTLFAEANLQVNRQDRMGLVGPNGAGKTTLFQLILGGVSADGGEVMMERNVTVGYLPQESAPVGEETVLELATAVDEEMRELKRLIKAMDEVPHTVEEGEESPHARFAERGGYQLEAKAKRIMAGLGFRDSDFERPARELSGGWVMRAHLARLLVHEPDLLMLDEPTNHLDLEALLWFQDYLKKYPGAVLVIAHDREFLNELVGSIVEIRQSRLIRYRGTYDEYEVQRQANEAQLMAAYEGQQREIARLMAFVNRFRSKNTKAAQAQSKLKMIDRMDRIEAPVSDDRAIDFRFPQPQRSGLKVISLSGIHHAYGKVKVYEGMDFQAERGQRIVLVGPNGAGKSTLLKILAGAVQPQAGERRLGHNVTAGYYAQYRTEMLNPGHTVLEEALNTPQRVGEQFVRTVLGGFLFQGDDVFKKVRVLSGGEKSRLALVKLLLNPPNLLLMDEPTTHLDLSSVDALLAALDQFEGTLVFISHDVYFIRSLANHVVHVQNGRLRHYPGDYQYYLDKGEGRHGAATPSVSPERETSPTEERPRSRGREQKRMEAEERQQRSRHRKKQEAVVAGLEKTIQKLESRHAEVSKILQDPATYQDGIKTRELNLEMADLEEQLASLNQQWETEATRLSEL